MKRLLVIDCSLWSDAYRPADHWTALADCPCEVFRVFEGHYPPRSAISGCTHAIVTGSEASIMQDDPWIIRVCALIQELVALDKAVLGSCFGHQALARAIAGKHHVRPAKTPEVGYVAVVRTEAARADPLFGAMPPLFQCFSSHFDEVWPLPQGFVRLARSEGCENAAMRLEGKNVYGIQHHPEMDEGAARLLLEAEAQRLCPAARAICLAAKSSPVRDDRVAAQLLGAFLAL